MTTRDLERRGITSNAALSMLLAAIRQGHRGNRTEMRALALLGLQAQRHLVTPTPRQLALRLT
jgi:hypothetical protein